MARSLLTVVILFATAAAAHPPVAGTPTVFVDGVPGPEGVAFAPHRMLVVGTTTGEVRRYAADGTFTTVGRLGESLAGVTVLRDGRILAASFAAGRVWSIAGEGGTPTVFASGIPGANFIIETRDGRILVSATTSGKIVEIVDGAPVDRAGGLAFPNGLATRRGWLYVAETIASRVSRLPMNADGTLGPPEVWATMARGADGIAFDRHGNLLVAGFGTLQVVARGATTATTLSSDPLLGWPSNVAFGPGRGFPRKALYVANFGNPLGTGTTILRLHYNHAEEARRSR